MKTILTFIFLGLLHTNLFANADKDTSFIINGSMIGFNDSTEVKLEDQNTGAQLAAGKIMKGGSGVWGEIPMTAHPDLSQADAEKMAMYVLSLDGEKPKD